MKTFKFNSQIRCQSSLQCFGDADYLNNAERIKNEPMLYSCDLESCYEFVGPGTLTSVFLASLPKSWIDAPDLIIDSRVHMLMKGWFPCIPGFHHDDVPRSRADGQPNYDNPEYHSEHCMMLIGDCCPTEFAIGEAEFPDVSMGQKYYKVWHPIVEEKCRTGELQKVSAPSGTLIFFDWQTWHQGTPAKKDGWRWFIRASRNTGRKPLNQPRRQVNVYLDALMEGW